MSRLNLKMGTNYKAHPFFKKMRAGEMINSQAKQVILNVFFQLASLNPQKPWKSIANETAMLTGVSVSTVFRLKTEKTNSMYAAENKGGEVATDPAPNSDQVLVIDEANQGHDSLDHQTTSCHETSASSTTQQTTQQPPQKKQKREPRPVSPRSMKRKVGPHVVRKKRLDMYDESVLTSIRLRLHQYCARKDSPTVGEFMGEINADPNLPSFSRSTFHHLLKDMGLSKFCKKKARQKIQRQQQQQQQQHQHQQQQQQQQQQQAPPPQVHGHQAPPLPHAQVVGHQQHQVPQHHQIPHSAQYS